MTKEEVLENGFKYLSIENESATAKIAFQGAHIFHFQPKDEQPLLWVSGKSNFENTKAIRGGVPICWPWFGEHQTDKSMPKHGFARISQWEVEEVNEINSSITEVKMTLSNSELFSHKFKLTAHFKIAKDLTISLTTKNLDEKPFTISQALHTYFAIDNIESVKVDGLDGLEFIDFVDGSKHIQDSSIVVTKEVDRIYQDVNYPLYLYGSNEPIVIESSGSNSSVVWNPWSSKCSQMNDMSVDSYKGFICVETTNTGKDEKIILPNATHTLEAGYSRS